VRPLVILAALLAGLAAATLLGPPPARARLRALPRSPLPDRLHASPLTGRGLSSPTARRAAAAAAGVGVALTLGGLTGLALGALTAVAAALALSRLEPAASRRERERAEADLPVVADLLAAGVCAGASIDQVTAAVAAAVGGPLGDRLEHVVAVTRLGADPAQAWAALRLSRPAGPSGVASAPDGIAGLGRSVARALDGGAPLGPALVRVAADQRAARRAAADLAARRVGVLAVLPLATCFLPAFVLVGVVPFVASVAGAALGSLR